MYLHNRDSSRGVGRTFSSGWGGVGGGCGGVILNGILQKASNCTDLVPNSNTSSSHRFDQPRLNKSKPVLI